MGEADVDGDGGAGVLGERGKDNGGVGVAGDGGREE